MTFACYRAPASLAYNLDFKKYNQIKSFKKARVREARTTLSQEKLHKRHCLRIPGLRCLRVKRSLGRRRINRYIVVFITLQLN